MPIAKHQNRSIWITVYGLLVAIGFVLLYVGIRGTFSPIVESILPVVYVMIVAILVRRDFAVTGNRAEQTRGRSGRFRIPDLVKSLICFAAACLWTLFSASATRETPVGDAIVGVPLLAILGIGAFFLGRGFYNLLRDTLDP